MAGDSSNPEPQAAGEPVCDTLAIVGVGLLGASVGLAAKRRGLVRRVLGLGRRPGPLDVATQRGAIDAGSTDPAEAIADAGLVVVATPLSAFAGAFDQVTQHARPGAVVTDVGSTKRSVARLAAEGLSNPSRFVGAHPMAGSEHAGPEHADAELFVGKPCVVCPTEGSDADAVGQVEAFFRGLGHDPLLRMSPAEHDEQVAAVSHLPHLAAVMLVEAAAELGGWELASTGFRDTTRLAASNPPMRADILDANREAVVAALRVYRSRLNAWLDALGEADVRDIASRLAEASSSRRQIDRR